MISSSRVTGISTQSEVLSIYFRVSNTYRSNSVSNLVTAGDRLTNASKSCWLVPPSHTSISLYSAVEGIMASSSPMSVAHLDSRQVGCGLHSKASFPAQEVLWKGLVGEERGGGIDIYAQ